LKLAQLPPNATKMKKPLECAACELGKSHRQPFASSLPSDVRAESPMDAFHADISGPVKNESIGGSKYISVVLDEASSYVFIACTASKDDGTRHVRQTIRDAKTKVGVPLKRFHSDGGGEYRSAAFLDELKKSGVNVTSTPAHTSQLNGKAERKNRTIWNTIRTLLASVGKHGLPSSFWAEAALTSVYLLNRTTSSSSIDPTKTAHEIFTGKKPSVKHLRTFGCDVFVHKQKVDRGVDAKLETRASPGIFVGYEEKKTAYRCYVDGKIVVSRDVYFVEQSFTHADSLHHVLTRRTDAAEEERLTVQEERLMTIHQLPPSSRTSRQAARIAALRLYEPMDEEANDVEMRQVREAQLVSAEEESDRCARDEARMEAACKAAADSAALDHSIVEDDLKVSEVEDVLDGDDDDDDGTPRPQEELNQEELTDKQKQQRGSVDPVSRRHTRSGVATGPLAVPTDSKKNSKKTKLVPVDTNVRRVTRSTAASAAAAVLSATTVESADLIHEPTTFQQAVHSPQREEWLNAMKEELRSMVKKKVFQSESAVECAAEGRRPIGCKWVYKLKRDASGRVERYKARLVAKGFTQQAGIDFFDTFAPVLKYKSLRLLLQHAARHDLDVQQMDVETAFLNGELKETVFMKLPPGIDQLMTKDDAGDNSERGGDDKSVSNAKSVWRLKKAIYGTKQASNVWHETINRTLTIALSFTPTISDPCVYVRRSRSNHVMYLGLFVDDLLAFHAKEDLNEWMEIKAKLMSTYTMKDLGAAQWVLGMKITRDRPNRLLTLSMESYVDKMLFDFHMVDAADAPTPEESSVRLTRDDEAITSEQQEEMVDRPYMELVGSLLYAATSIFFEISHSVTVLTRHMQRPGPKHWMAAKRVLRYLKSVKHLGITYGQRRDKEKKGSEISSLSISSSTLPHTPMSTVEVYCDADWAGDVDDRRSTSGILLLLDGAPIVWSSRKQATVALSTAEAEYMAMSAALQELKWMDALLNEIHTPVHRPIVLWTDNQAALSIATARSITHSRTKHIDIRHHYIREMVISGAIDVRWCRSEEQLADVMTKGLNKQTYAELTHRIKTRVVSYLHTHRG
jgi:Reverse transcriptase (RNA-dependent DNA polymerase)